ncbi:MAG: signal peptidase II [Elusimicrobia bacterium]|nr:signal peptidase II [Elusimicrobiota bacterium]
MRRPNPQLIACFFLVMLDQLSKVLAYKRLAAHDSIRLTRYFHLTYVENTGISFGMMQGTGNRLLLVMNILLTAAIYVFWRKRRTQISPPKADPPPAENFDSWGLILILAGAFGNILDRLIRGYVVDFLDFKVWPVFNLADAMITAGVALYLWSAIRARRCHHQSS